jgi:aspartate kinase
MGKLFSLITLSVIPCYLKKYNVAVVCSARSGTTESAGTTSLLLEAMQLTSSCEGNGERVTEIIGTKEV